MLPSRLKLTITVMSMSGLARDAGGGFQQDLNRANACLILSTFSDGACADAIDNGNSSAAAKQMSDLPRAAMAHLMSDATCTFTILSGSVTGSPRLILSTTSMPETTSPTTVYFPFSGVPSANMIKNCEFAESGLAARAIPTIPRLKGTLENSADRFGYFEPPVPSKFLPSPVCAMNPSITLWNGTLL